MRRRSALTRSDGSFEPAMTGSAVRQSRSRSSGHPCSAASGLGGWSLPGPLDGDPRPADGPGTAVGAPPCAARVARMRHGLPGLKGPRRAECLRELERCYDTALQRERRLCACSCINTRKHDGPEYHSTWWKPGTPSPNPSGRPPGAGNKIAAEAKQIILGAASILGGAEALAAWVKSSPRNAEISTAISCREHYRRLSTLNGY